MTVPSLPAGPAAPPRGRRSRAPRTPLLVVLVVLALIAGCQGGDDPQQELQRAVVTTLDAELGFELRAEADRGALEQLGAAAGDAAQFLSDFRVLGTYEPDGPTALSVELAPGQPILEAVALPDGELRLRTGLGELLGVGGDSPADALEPELDRRGASDEQRAALIAGFEGDWIAISDAGGIGEALAGTDAEGTAETEPLDRDRLLAAIEVTDAADDGERRLLDVRVDLDALLALEDDEVLSEPVPARVEIVDDVIQRIRVELTDELEGVDEGRVSLELLLSDHGDAATAAPPPVEATVTMAELEELLELIGG